MQFQCLFSGFQPGQPVSNIQIKVFIPHVKVEMDTNAVFKLILMTIKPHGRITAYIGTCVVVAAARTQHFNIYILS